MSTAYSPVNNNRSFATVTNQIVFPFKEQAVILQSIDNIPIEEYARAIGNKIGAAEVCFISKISHSRVCVYTSTKELPDELIEKQTNFDKRQISAY